MKIKHYKRAWWDKPLEIHRDRCYCTSNACGDRWHTNGWTIYLFQTCNKNSIRQAEKLRCTVLTLKKHINHATKKL